MADIFAHRDVVDFLKANLEESRRRNSQYSLRSWCRQLGLKQPASLSLVLNRKRPLSKHVAELVKEKLLHTDDERDYFDIITSATYAEDEQTKFFYKRLAADFKPLYEQAHVRLEQFRLISNWYHFVILEMTRLKDFHGDVDWIYDRLGKRVTKRDVRSALMRLIELGYLRRDPHGILQRSEPYLKTETDVPNLALRSMHAELIALGAQALVDQDVQRRDITGFNTITTREKIPEAKRMISRFRQQLMTYLEDPTGDTVYQVNVQMFDLLEPSSEPAVLPPPSP